MTVSLYRNRRFLSYLAGHTASLHGLWMYRVGLGWLAWDLSSSEMWVGIVAATQFAPVVVFGPIFGVLADRFNRRRASLLINSCTVVNMSALSLLMAADRIDILLLTGFSFLQGTLDGAHMPVRMTIMPNIVSPAHLRSAIAAGAITFSVSRFVGPALAGVSITTLGAASTFVFNAAAHFILILAVLATRLNPSTAGSEPKGNVFAQFREGMLYARRSEAVRGLLTLMAIVALFGRGPLEMMPAFADLVFNRGSGAFATLMAASGVGALIASVLFSRDTAWLTLNKLWVAVGLCGALIVVFGMTDVFWLAVFAVATIGLLLAFCSIGSQILIHATVDDTYRGRVSGFWALFVFGGTAIGSLLLGIAASVWHLQWAVAFAGGICCGGAVVAIIRKLRRAATREELPETQ